jgi:hypothetical protein
MTEEHTPIPRLDPYEVITTLLQQGQTFEQIAAAIPFTDEKGNQLDAAQLRAWYEEATKLKGQK